MLNVKFTIVASAGNAFRCIFDRNLFQIENTYHCFDSFLILPSLFLISVGEHCWSIFAQISCFRHCISD